MHTVCTFIFVKESVVSGLGAAGFAQHAHVQYLRACMSCYSEFTRVGEGQQRAAKLAVKASHGAISKAIFSKILNLES